MAKIIKITIDQVMVGLDDGSAIDVPRSEFTFPIQVNTPLNIYNHDGKNIFAPDHKTGFEVEPEIEGKIYVNKIAFCLFALLLGFVGAHEFYAKRFFRASLFFIIPISFIVIASLAEDPVIKLIILMLALLYLSYIIIFVKIYAIIILCNRKENRNGNILLNK